MTFRLGLRFNRHEISVVKTDDPRRTLVANAYPDDASRRSRILTHWGQQDQSPRRPESPSIVHVPLSTRAQTVLSYRLPDQQRSMVNGETRPLIQSREDQQPGIKARSHLDTSTTLDVESNTQHSFGAFPATRVKHGL